jgi:hypothetical protein
MGILLIHESVTTGQVALSPKKLNDTHHAARHYTVADGAVWVEAVTEELTAHDADEILQMEGWRKATPSEQNQYAKKQKRLASIDESHGGD